MLIYVMSSPDDNLLLLTTNRDVMMAGRKAVKDAGDMVEVNTWDTEKSPILSINLNFEMPEEPPIATEANSPPNRVLP